EALPSALHFRLRECVDFSSRRVGGNPHLTPTLSASIGPWRAERELPCSSAQRHLEAALGGGARRQRLVPPFDVRVVREVDLVPLVPPGPAEDREIGDRHLAAG